MKAQIKGDTFDPIKLEITFEKTEEIECFYSIMNHSAICDAAAPFLALSEIKAALNKRVDRFYYQNCFDKFASKLQEHPCIARHYE